ncbi:SufBD protein [candidate division MSBL1 archaeon SCGC-AAA259A05]|uniref:SufBD protein n=1 Tax=candidate division MSBL1 archaeon SCGC-AAA259A05 TaxID=1698259 RepID=A0A133UBV8_9EURY|nr:SufBD protein [candidate division MSBL1 archaeon SCGC-AAA259A05]
MEVEELYRAAEIEGAVSDPKTAHLILNKEEVIDMNDVPGLSVEPKSTEKGVDVAINVAEGSIIEKPVHLCFGMTQTEGTQKINLKIKIEKDAEIGVLAHCVFPRALDVKHVMDADIHVEENAEYTYLEKHIHSPEGGTTVIPRAEVKLEENAKFKTDFELVQGRVGLLDIDYETTCGKNSMMEMTAKVNGTEDDEIRISEKGNLTGEGARGVLTTRVAARDNTEAEVYNKLSATALYARGHVDCKEIVQDNGRANAVPVVEVKHPQAHVTHEAAIGSVDRKQLETLMARGLSEEEGADLIIEGLLS